VNQASCKDAGCKISSADCVILAGEELHLAGETYIMLHKPANYCCSHSDDGHPSALRLLPANRKKLHFAGRLDADTTGLVLLSSDGQWCHRVTSPKQSVEKRKFKTYQVELAEPLSENDRLLLCAGILLRNEQQKTLAAHIEAIDSLHYRIAIQEGKYHQVKRMFAAVNNRVVALHREQIGDIRLDPSLEAGQYRPLSATEITEFMHESR
jgi:16S rRNA pseudouridine516 synthase